MAAATRQREPAKGNSTRPRNLGESEILRLSGNLPRVKLIARRGLEWVAPEPSGVMGILSIESRGFIKTPLAGVFRLLYFEIVLWHAAASGSGLLVVA
jgi:hypothetical protein